MKMKVNRQGDILVVPIEGAIPGDIQQAPREGGRVILAHGEATGHAHAICDDGATLYRDPEPKGHAALFRDPYLNKLFFNTPELNVAFLKVHDDVVGLVHDEHTRHDLYHGNKVVVRQREYDDRPVRDAGVAVVSRYVAD